MSAVLACNSCGHRNEDGDTFCGSCGAYMGWSENVTASAAPARQATTEGAPVAAAAGSGAPLTTLPHAPTADAPPPVEAPSTTHADELEAEIEARRRDEAQRVATEAEAQRARDEAAAKARAEADARAREEQDAARRAQEAAEAEARVRAAAEAQAARQAQAEAEAEAKAHEREAAEARAQDERLASEAAAAKEGAAAEVDERERAHAEAMARAEAERLAAQEALAAAQAKAAQESLARQEAELATQSAIRQKEEADARAAMQARAAAEAEAGRAAAEAQAAKAAEEARQADAARRASALVAQLPAARPTPAAQTPAAQTSATPAPATPAAATAAAAGLNAPGAVQPGAAQPTAIKPGMPQRQREERAVETEKQYHHGDLICGQCGTGNLATRKFCRTCGTTLAAATVHKLPWWRRIVTRRPKVVAAGVRPQRDRKSRSDGNTFTRGLRGVFRTATRVVLALVVLLALVITLVPPVRREVTKRTSSAYTKVRQTVTPRYVPVRPVAATAPFGSAPGSDPVNAIDGNTASHWASAPHPPPIVLVVKFKEESTIRKIGLTLGDQDDPANFAKQPRPRDIHLVYLDAAGKKAGGHDFTVKDVQTFQSFGINARKTASIEIHVNSLYSSIGGDMTSVAEVEFFTLK